jgi:hypothetical protein
MFIALPRRDCLESVVQQGFRHVVPILSEILFGRMDVQLVVVMVAPEALSRRVSGRFGVGWDESIS